MGTHGRSLFIIDDIGPLQELTADIAGQDAHIFTPRDALGSYLLPGSADWTGNADFRGANPPEGALIRFYLKSFTGDQAVVTIKNALDQPVAKFKLPGTPGINRFSWDLKPTEEVLTKYGGEGNKFVRPGVYTITLSYGQAKVTQKLNVAIAPGIETR